MLLLYVHGKSTVVTIISKIRGICMYIKKCMEFSLEIERHNVHCIPYSYCSMGAYSKVTNSSELKLRTLNDMREAYSEDLRL